MRITLGRVDWKKKEYEKISIREQVEVLSLMGDVTAHGGHLLEPFVRPTLEVILTELPKHLTSHFDQESGLALIRLEDV